MYRQGSLLGDACLRKKNGIMESKIAKRGVRFTPADADVPEIRECRVADTEIPVHNDETSDRFQNGFQICTG